MDLVFFSVQSSAFPRQRSGNSGCNCANVLFSSGCVLHCVAGYGNVIMSGGWAAAEGEMVSRECPPRVLRDIQEITGKLFQEFSASGEPITDDSLVLQRLCVKLEYLLETCTKEKTVLGGSKHYWHWVRDSLKKTKRFSDGLKYIETNKEVRTPQGRGRALIRYSLVHQSLADNFQHCLMNQSTCAHYLKPMSVLMRPLYAALFLSTLYEINAVRFDLNSKGYDLDTAWPTFASKRCSTGFEDWPLSVERTRSVGSYLSHVNNSALMLPELPHMRGAFSTSGILDYESRGATSSGPPSVDQRLEELVLELNESDQKIQDTEEAMKRMETEADAAATSATEEKEILAGLVCDLQSKNFSLHGALSQMSTECQNREQSWQLQCDQLQSALAETEAANSTLRSKVAVLEEDKRNLEDTVSARMTRITSGFSGTDIESVDIVFKSDGLDGEQLQRNLLESEKGRRGLEERIHVLQMELAAVPERLEAEKKALMSSLAAEFESERAEWKGKLAAVYENATGCIFKQLADVMPNGFLTPVMKLQSAHEKVDGLASSLTELMNELCELRNASAKLHQGVYLDLRSREQDQSSETAELEEKREGMMRERDNALRGIGNLRGEVENSKMKFHDFKLECEVEASTHQRDMLEMKAANRRLGENVKKEQIANSRLAEEICRLQRQCDDSALDLKNFKQKCTELEEKVM